MVIIYCPKGMQFFLWQPVLRKAKPYRGSRQRKMQLSAHVCVCLRLIKLLVLAPAGVGDAVLLDSVVQGARRDTQSFGRLFLDPQTVFQGF